MLKYLCFCLGISYLLLSCSVKEETKATGEPLKPVDTVVINFVGHWKGEGYKEELIYKIIRSFEFENPGIKINLKFPKEVYTGNEYEFMYTQITAPASDWDVIMINNNFSNLDQYFKYSEWPRDYLVDFSQYPEFVENSIDYVTSEESKSLYGGIVPGHALDANNSVLWCNSKVAAKIGVEPKPFEMTADDLISYLQALQAYNLKNNTHIQGLNVNSGWMPLFSLAFQLFATEIGDFDRVKNTQYDEEKIVAWGKVLDFAEKISKLDIIDREWSKNSFSVYYKRILDEECLFTSTATWMYNLILNLDSAKCKEVIPLELPSFKPGKSYVGNVSIPWIVPKNSPHREEAIRFMLYWCRREVADDWIKHTKGPTGIKSSLVQSGFGTDVYENFDYTINKKYDGKKTSTDIKFIFGEKNRHIPNYFLEVITGQMTSEEAMRSIKRKLVTR